MYRYFRVYSTLYSMQLPFPCRMLAVSSMPNFVSMSTCCLCNGLFHWSFLLIRWRRKLTLKVLFLVMLISHSPFFFQEWMKYLSSLNLSITDCEKDNERWVSFAYWLVLGPPPFISMILLCYKIETIHKLYLTCVSSSFKNAKESNLHH